MKASGGLQEGGSSGRVDGGSGEDGEGAKGGGLHRCVGIDSMMVFETPPNSRLRPVEQQPAR